MDWCYIKTDVPLLLCQLFAVYNKAVNEITEQQSVVLYFGVFNQLSRTTVWRGSIGIGGAINYADLLPFSATIAR